MNNLSQLITAVCKETHVPMAEAVFGAPGLDAVFKVMNAAKEFYRHVEPERITGQIVIFKMVSSAETADRLPPRPVADFAAMANQDISDLVLEIAVDDQIYERSLDKTPEELATCAIVYRFHGAVEEFLAGTERKSVIRLDAAARSQFSVPTFPNLRAALQRYARENIRESTCYLFMQAWHDTNRLFFKASPEWIMRNSLTQFLRNRLGADHNVWPEQNVDESHPVDIQVQPMFNNNRLMLIEIKWLGDSFSAEDGRITARHRDRRAQDGASQLAQYLDDKRKFAPSQVVHGYYVIIDARRRGMTTTRAVISRADGMHYESEDLSFDPAPHETRRDFDPPYRMFARPVCSD